MPGLCRIHRRLFHRNSTRTWTSRKFTLCSADVWGELFGENYETETKSDSRCSARRKRIIFVLLSLATLHEIDLPQMSGVDTLVSAWRTLVIKQLLRAFFRCGEISKCNNSWEAGVGELGQIEQLATNRSFVKEMVRDPP